jgi:stage IV sporulation protein FB
MRYTARLLTACGVPVRIHATFPLALAAFGFEGYLRAGWGEMLASVALVCIVFVCVVLHELGHSIRAMRYGVVVRDIVLLPVGGMARVERVPEIPRQEIAIALCGPAVNAVIAAVIALVMWIRRHPFDLNNDFVSAVLVVNLALVFFNLIPAFPMDGGRILRGLLATRMPYLDATRAAKNVGLLIAQLFALTGFASTMFIMLPLIAVFIFVGAISEENMVLARISEEDSYEDFDGTT